MLRQKILFSFFIIFGILISVRLFYWQIISASQLSLKAQSQYLRRFEIPAQRGEILTSDGFPIVTNQEAYLLYAKPKELKEDPKDIAKKLAKILFKDEGDKTQEDEGDIAKIDKKKADLEKFETDLVSLLSEKDVFWVMLAKKVTREEKGKIDELNISGLDFQQDQMRFYPEGSMSAQLLGFVGSDDAGRDKGYLGIEGFYNRQLEGKPGFLEQESDPNGRPILTSSYLPVNPEDGYSITLTIDRSVQLIVEEELKKAVEKYQAKGGLAIVMDPKTGAVIASGALPSYDPANWQKFDQSTFKDPVISDTYEPGSTFKVIVMSAALNEGVLDPDTICDKCTGPREIGGFTIRTWNDKYYPDSKPSDIIQHSDNIGMVFVSERLGKDNFYKYLKKFGIGEVTNIDLQGETSPDLRKFSDWKPIDLATASFGQGVAVTPIQLTRAVSVIANGGNLMKPFLVQKIRAKDGKEIYTTPQVEKSDVISKKTATIMTQMMVNAVDNGEAKAFKPKGYTFAGKTGTAQIPVAGHYDPQKTLASFEGFGPVEDPKFVMLVRIDEPKTSQFGSETAAPTFFSIAQRLYNYWGISPS